MADMTRMTTVIGMVIATQPVGEYDRRIVLLTKERGKITAFAKGARRPHSGLLAASNTFAFGTFYLYEGRNSYTVRQAEIQNYFSEFRTDLEGAWYGLYFLEMADYFTRENSDEKEMLKLLYQTMRALISPNLDNALVRYIFEWKVMVLNGEYPDVFQCGMCGKAVKSAFFDSNHFCIVCDECMQKNGNYPKLSQSSLYALQYIAGTLVERLYTFQVTEQVLCEMKRVIDLCKKRVIDREFKTEEFLKTL